MVRRVEDGVATPLGVTVEADGVNVAVYSRVAQRVEFCVFDGPSPDAREERIELPMRTGHVHHGFVEGVAPGSHYGFRVHGPWDPADGLWCNPAKLLVDPYARRIDGSVVDDIAVDSHDHTDPSHTNDTDNAGFVPRSVVVGPEDFDWGHEERPRTPWPDTVVYEAHVSGLTRRHPEVPLEHRGTYLGVAHPAVVSHLLELGVTTVQLMPVHHFVSERFITRLGLSNYWGYSTLGFFAPHAAYASEPGRQVHEFKSMVRALHQAGLEVVLDVVYNHTAEGGPLGPTLSFRGVDNDIYYRLNDEDRSSYVSYTGTGNTIDVRNSATLRMIMDSLRYWVTEMHVDGFRFDLASALARDNGEFDRTAAFFDLIHQDPVINQVKLIAEPWDLGPGGYQIGAYPTGWSEWNGKYRDEIRDFWRGTPGMLPRFAYRVTGSSDLFDHDGRRPTASVNFVTAHDGFTLADVVAYEERHNEANGEGNRDGHSDNRTWNGGVEGPTDDPDIVENRKRRQKALLATLLLSQGVPMLSGGDELGRTQRGNNNAWCQDNDLSWHDWYAVDDELLGLTKRLTGIRRRHGVFRRRAFFEGKPDLGSTLDDIGWFRIDGHPLSEEGWQSITNTVMVFLNGRAVDTPSSSFLMIVNGTAHDEIATVPAGLGGERWRVELDTADSSTRDDIVVAQDEWTVRSWSMVLLERVDEDPS